MSDFHFKLIATEPLGPTSLKYLFSTRTIFSEPVESPVFNIHNLAEVCFLFQREPHRDRYNYRIKTKKHTSAKDLKINLKAVCAELDFAREWLCTEQWSELSEMGSCSECSREKYWEVEFYITVDKMDSMIIKLYEDQNFTGIHLSTAEGSVVVHRAILGANSDVFKMMLSQEWKETAEGRVQIEGVTLQTLQDLKQYMYLGTLPDEGLRPLLQLAMCYLMNNLKTECLMKLAHSVTSENLHDILEYSFLNKIPELTFAVLETMPKHIVDDARQFVFKKEQSVQTDGKNERGNEE